MPKLGCLLALAVLIQFGGIADSAAAESDRTETWLLEPPKNNDDVDVGIVEKATEYVDVAQRQASEGFNNFVIQVDDFFGDATASDSVINNASWARLRLDAKKPADEKIDIKPSLKLRVVLPQTERRFKLLFSTEEDDISVGGDNVGGASGGSTDGDQNASFAIRFIRSARSKVKLNLDLGIRQRDSDLQYFTRLSTGLTRDFGQFWTAGVSNSYYYYNKSGFEDKLTFTFRRAQFVREDVIFRSFTEFNWRNGRSGSIIGQTLGVYKQFGERKSLAFELLAAYHTALSDGLEDRFRGHEFRFRWRHNVWRPWFYYEFWPSVSWPATNNYDQSYGALLRVEMVIGQR